MINEINDNGHEEKLINDQFKHIQNDKIINFFIDTQTTAKV